MHHQNNCTIIAGMADVDSKETHRRRRIMVFDVETTGLVPKKRATIALTDLPHILQLTFVIFDTQYWRVVKSVDLYIKVADTIEIPERITEITGITREMCAGGVSIEKAMHEFYEEYMLCDTIVAHNIDFDKEMIRIEMERCANAQDQINWPCGIDLTQIFDDEYHKTQNKKTFCTMRVGRNICKIERTGKNGVYYKSPKLVELYEHLFQMTPHGLHSSLVDTYVCLRCFVKICFHFELRMTSFPRMTFSPIVAHIPALDNASV